MRSPQNTPPDRDRSTTASEVGIFAVVVLYRQRPEDATTLRTLLRAAKCADGGQLRLGVLIVDNTPGGQDPGPLPPGAVYRGAPHNPGLAVAYNAASATAALEGYSWLLTLDQDTDLPEEFLERLVAHARQYQGDASVAAIVPHIVDSGRHLSPLRFAGGWLPRILPIAFSGIAPAFTSALNSAALLRISALGQIGGYDEQFPLNNSDTSLFHRVGEAGLRVAVAGDLLVHHELAIMDRGGRMSIERYRQLLADERAFWDRHMGPLARAERLLRLVARTAKDLLQRRNPDFRRVSLEEIRLRLFTRRKTRLDAWSDKQRPRNSASRGVPGRSSS